MIERRKNKRLKVQEGAFVVHSGHIGQILNISLGGFLCQCIGNKNISNGPQVCNIFCAHDGGKLKLKAVQIQRITQNIYPLSPWNTTLVKRCGIMFNELTTQQSTHLENYINTLEVE